MSPDSEGKVVSHLTALTGSSLAGVGKEWEVPRTEQLLHKAARTEEPFLLQHENQRALAWG